MFGGLEELLVAAAVAVLVAPVALTIALVVQGRRRAALEVEVRRLAVQVEALGRRVAAGVQAPTPTTAPVAAPSPRPSPPQGGGEGEDLWATPTPTPNPNPAAAPGPVLDTTLPPPLPPPPPPPRAAPPAWTPPPPQPAAPPRRIDWESLVGVRLFSWVAGVAMLVAAVSFLRWSIENGWLGPAVRAAIGALVGVGLLVGAETERARRYGVTAQSLAAAGVGILFSTVFAAHALWDLIPPSLTFGLLILVAAVAIAYAVRRSSLTMALLGLAGGFATPILLSTGQDRPVGLFSYLLLLNAAMAWVAHKRRWPVLGAIALGVTAVYQLGWVVKFLGTGNLPVGLVVFLIFPAFAVLSLVLSRRGRPAGEAVGDLARWTASLAALPSVLFLLHVASSSALAAQWPLVAGFAVILCAGLLLVAALLGPEWLHLLGAAAAVAALGALAWGDGLPPGSWPLTLVPVALLAAVLLGGPLLLERRGKALLAEGRFAVYGVPALVAGVIPRRSPFLEHVPGDALLLAVALLLLTAGTAAVAARRRDGVLLGVSGLAAAVPGLVLSAVVSSSAGPALGAGLLLGVIGLAALLRAERGTPREDSGPWFTGGTAALLVVGQLIALVADDAHTAFVLALPIQLLLTAGLLVVAARTGRHAVSLIAAVTGFLAAAPLAFFRDATAAQGLAMGGALWALQLGAAWLQLRRGATSRLLLWAPALSSGLTLLLARQALHALDLQVLVGPAALLLALALAPHLRLLLRAPDALAAERSRIVVVAGAMLGLVTAAIPLQLENEWITIGWALLVPALAALHRRVPHRGLLLWMAGLGGAVLVRLVVNDEVLHYHARSGAVLLNFWLYAYGVPALALLGAARLLPAEDDRVRPDLPRLAPILAAAGGLLLFVLLNLEIADAFSTGTFVRLRLRGSLAYDLALTIGWALFAIGLLVAGLLMRSRPTRVTAIALLAVTVVKGFLLDLGRLDGLYRVASFVGLAVSLSLVAVVLQKFVLHDRETPPAP